jgi:hypothetical protein
MSDDVVPAILLRIAAVKAQIQAERAQAQNSESAIATPAVSNILDRASIYQQKASDNRLGLPRTLNQSLQNATKSKQVQAERAAARKAAQSKSDVRVDALLFRIPSIKTKRGNAKTRMDQAWCNNAFESFCDLHHDCAQDLKVRVSKAFASMVPIATAMNDLLEGVLHLFSRQYPLTTHDLQM